MSGEALESSLLHEVEALRARIHELEAWNHAVEQAGEALRKSDESFRRVFDHSNDGIFIVDLMGDRIVDANRRAADMLGYSLDELLRIPMSALHPDDMPKVQACRDSVEQNGFGWTSEVWYVTKSGERIPTEMSASLLELSDRTYIVASVRDITERKRAVDELRRTNRRMKGDLEAAARIQQSLLPRASLVADGLRTAWRVRPCERLGGDTLNILPLDANHVGFFLVDVSGHGVSAAMQSLAIHRVLSPFPPHASLLVAPDGKGGTLVRSPAEVATQLNTLFPMDLETGQYMTLFYGVLALRTRELSFVSAGQGAPVHVQRGGAVREIPAYDFPIGIFKDTVYRDQRLVIQPGDRLFVFSDGIEDRFDEGNEPFGRARALQTIEARRTACLQDAVQDLIDTAVAWGCESCVEDDMSVLAFELA